MKTRKNPTKQEKQFEQYLVLRKYANLINRVRPSIELGPDLDLTSDKAVAVDHLLMEASRAIGGDGIETIRDQKAQFDSYYGDIIALVVALDISKKTLIYDTENDNAIVENFEDWYGRWIDEHE